MKLAASFAFIAVALLLPLAAQSQQEPGRPSQPVQPDPAAESVKMRQGLMAAVRWQFAPIAAFARDRSAELTPELVGRIRFLANLAEIAPQGFVEPSADVEGSNALPAVWEQREEFARLMHNFQAETARLAELAAAGQGNEVRGHFARVAETCSACHETFRREMPR
ncbi:cytochrome c [Telmatospirillum sp. J64-1]|uniref:cytochrome c n=1 Tax=Telmatospirillum sp. J64-1 TaxID=2502183 RepID=UPI00115E38AA|nr:cytochrome c [Telmatospirillum sp. J64-1]